MGAKGALPVRVLVADQNCIIRAGIRVLLMETRSWQRYEIAEAESTEQAIDLLTEGRYDVVLLDCGLPGRGGIKATEIIAARWPRTRVLGVNASDDILLVERMMGAGASGVILWNIEIEMLALAIRTVLAGKHFYSNEVAIRLLERKKGLDRGVMDRLTCRERQILQSILEGFAEREIAAKLGIAKRTVDKHRQHIHFKLGTRTPLELVQAGLKLGLVRVD